MDSTSGQLTVNAALSIGSLLADGTGQGANGSYTGVMTHNTTVTITINGASNGNGVVSLVSGMTYTPASTTSLWSFVNTGNVTLKTGGKNLAAVTIATGVSGGPGTVLQGDNLSVAAVQSGVLTLTSGTFNAGSFGTTTTQFSSNNSNNRTLILGTGLTLGGNISAAQTIFTIATSTGLTFTKNNAVIEVLAPTTAGAGMTFSAPGVDTPFNGLILDPLTTNSTISMNAASKWTTWTIGAGWNLLIGQALATNLSGAAVFNGTTSNFTGMQSSTASATFVSASGCTASNIIVQAITIPTGCTASNMINMGSVVGFTTQTPPKVGGIIGG